MQSWTQADMENRLVRYADLIPCKNAFVDTRTPGSDRKENFTIVGPGVSENPDQHVHVSEPHGFNTGGARQPGGCLNSQHSHETAEVFVVHSGHWRFWFGADRQDGYVDGKPGDVVSVPIHMFRGFEKLDEGTDFLWVVLGEDNPGRVTWAPSVFDLADKYGLKLLKNGTLVDTVAGETIPESGELETPLGPEDVAALATPPLEKMAEGVCLAEDMTANTNSPLTGDGVVECGVITPTETEDGFSAGPIVGWWPHGFNLRQMRLESGAGVAMHARKEAEVLFVQEGTLEVSWEGGRIAMGPGDTLSVPIGLSHAFRNAASVPLKVFIVRGGDSPSMPEFDKQQVAAE